MPEEVSINLGEQNKGPPKKSCFDGVCPPNPMLLIDEILKNAPMLLGVMLTYMKMDQFQRPLANTAEQMIEGLVPQIEKNATTITKVVSSFARARQNANKGLPKGDLDFTTDDKIHLMKLLIKEDNYLDSYETVIDFLKSKRPGFVKALYKSLLANQDGSEPILSHSESKKGKHRISTNDSARPTDDDDKAKPPPPSDEEMDKHIGAIAQAATISKEGLKGQGMIKSKKLVEEVSGEGKLNRKLTKLEKQKSQLEQEKESNESKLKNLKTEQDNMEKELKKSKKQPRIDELTKQIDEHKKEMETIQKNNEEIIDKIAILNKTEGELKQKKEDKMEQSVIATQQQQENIDKIKEKQQGDIGEGKEVLDTIIDKQTNKQI